MKTTVFLNQIVEGLQSEGSLDLLLATLGDARAALHENPELIDFFNCVASFVGIDLALIHEGVEIDEFKLTPIQPEMLVSLIEPGEYQILCNGRMLWQQELRVSDLYGRETKLAAADEAIVPVLRHELSDLDVWLSVIPGVESGTLKLELNV
jgi:hypothetical protein